MTTIDTLTAREIDQLAFDTLQRTKRRNAEQGVHPSDFTVADLGSAPDSFQKPKYGTPAYAIARRVGWISEEEEQQDRIFTAQRRARSLQTCHRFSLYERPRCARPKETGAYVPELSATLDNDPNLTDGARRCARKLSEIIYRKNRAGRFCEITVNYLMQALGRSRRTVQRYLRLLEREGYIHTQVIRSTRARMCVGLSISLCQAIFPRHHKEKWPAKAENSGASKLSQKYSFKLNTPRKDLISVHQWALSCMDGVFRAFMKTDPLGLSPDALP